MIITWANEVRQLYYYYYYDGCTYYKVTKIGNDDDNALYVL